jgi:hypothetical protein
VVRAAIVLLVAYAGWSFLQPGSAISGAGGKLAMFALLIAAAVVWQVTVDSQKPPK